MTEETHTVLIVEDDRKLRETMSDYLSQNDFSILTASDGVSATEVFDRRKDDIEIILLDIMLPKKDGIEVLRHIRKSSTVPVIILSARETEQDQIMGFQAGADHYITKPFLMSVLREQILALLNRVSLATPPHAKLTRGALSIDTDLHRVSVGGDYITTTPKEYELLCYFIQNENMVLSRDTILDNVWGIDYYGDFRTVDTIIKQLRKKLGVHRYIRSVYGVGYYFEVNDDN